jgi:glycosyltransferase involved in cell wall biosynthesis
VNLLLVNWQDRLNPLAGGAETHLHEIFGRIAALGHHVTMLVSGFAGGAPREVVDGLEVHRTGSRHTFSLAAPRYYRAHLAKERFDGVVEALNKVPLYSPLWARQPVVLLVHHLFGATAFREASAPVAAATWMLERGIPLAYRHVPAQAISSSTAADLADRGLRSESVAVIHPGVDTRFFSPSDVPDRAGIPTFAYVGRLRKYKRVDLMLLAAAGLRRAGVAARVIVAGRGDQDRELRSLAGRLGLDADFRGYVSEDEKRSILRSAWANVFTSPKEGWGMTNIEAAACGTSSVASDSPGLRESVMNERTGLLVPHGDVDALTAALRRIATDRELVERLGAQALEFARGFTWDRAADRTLAHLAETVR